MIDLVEGYPQHSAQVKQFIGNASKHYVYVKVITFKWGDPNWPKIGIFFQDYIEIVKDVFKCFWLRICNILNIAI